ncbi:Filamentation induced by cAMP protein Fic [Magnetospirillum sp. LM-5]|uniref:Fic family protein n=1 Tax=Magnetospirillum sp. LM-5 TaxID=2681466 RepID=UPI00138127C3|nr:Fic/DOC family N-terminal domain-containing protein [Magnetospirillum sp. LM-5]CAA7616514.1 Filamentation induced by cAMP protein Fic [Magnetospirillum sp. LM-5]
MDQRLDFSEAVQYHYGHFPPPSLDAARLIKPLTRAAASLARYDQMLKGMHNSEILLAPLRSQEAVVSSRMEGTVSTLDEVLQYEADHAEDGDAPGVRVRDDVIEVALYGRAMRNAQRRMEDGAPLSEWLIRSAHAELLGLGRGARMTPGSYKTEQNYIADRGRRKVSFVPVSPERLTDGMGALVGYMADDEQEILIRTALAHLEFEALHPFKDGNGRIGRMLITLMLWNHRVISAPHFYVSAFLEENRDEYIDRMREVSRVGAWTDWVEFFLGGLDAQARRNLAKAEEISDLYEDMKDRFRETLSSQWSTRALDFLFSRPVFRNSDFTRKSGIPEATAQRFARALSDARLLKTVSPAAGRRPALFSFEPLLSVVRSA